MASEETKKRRNRLIQLIHIGKAKLGWDDAAYEAFLAGLCGKESSAAMSVREMERALAEMRRLGFATHHARRVREEERGLATPAQLEYIKGMWQKCARNKSESALGVLVKRIAHVDHLRFLDVASARQVILALRDMMEKAGFDPDTSEAQDA